MAGNEAAAYWARRKYNMFKLLADARFKHLLKSMGPWKPNHKEWSIFDIHSQTEADRESKLFRTVLGQSFAAANASGLVGRRDNPLFWNLRNGFVVGDVAGLTKELKFAFHSFVLRSRLSRAVTQTHEKLADFRFPYEWFPATRTMQRTIHLHVGPTNSGKTYQALKALEGARSGIYAGPLRLLAHEIYTRFQAKGLRCALVTGRRAPDARGRRAGLPELHGGDGAAQPPSRRGRHRRDPDDRRRHPGMGVDAGIPGRAGPRGTSVRRGSAPWT